MESQPNDTNNLTDKQKEALENVRERMRELRGSLVNILEYCKQEQKKTRRRLLISGSLLFGMLVFHLVYFGIIQGLIRFSLTIFAAYMLFKVYEKI